MMRDKKAKTMALTAVETAFIMLVLTVFSKVFGLFREIVLANYFGISSIIDSYVMAIAIPGMVVGGVIGAVSVAYTPVYSSIVESDGISEGNHFTSSVLKVLCVISIVFSLFGIIFSDVLVKIFASGFNEKTAALTSSFLKVSFCYLAFSGTSDILESFLRYKGVFLPQVAFGILQNVVLIIGIIISAKSDYHYLIVGYLVVYILRLFIMGKISQKFGFTYVPRSKTNEFVRKIFYLSFPVFLGSYMTQINIFVDKSLASSLPGGSIAALNYASLLMGMIMGFTVTIMTTIIYPKIAQASSANDEERFNRIVQTGMMLVVIIALPSSVGGMIYSKDIVSIAYERGAFDSIATHMTTSAFIFFSFGIVFMSLNAFITRIYYAKHNMKFPVIFAAIGVTVNIVLNLILVRGMAHSGLALSTSIAAMVECILLILGLKVQYSNVKLIKSKRALAKVIFAAVVSLIGSWIIYYGLMTYNGVLTRYHMTFVISVVFACVSYLLLLISFKIDEVQLLKSIVKLN